MDRMSLSYCEGASDKIYQAEIVPVSDGFQMNFAYGRRGSTMNTGTKTSTPVPYAQAKKIFDTLVNGRVGERATPCSATHSPLVEPNKRISRHPALLKTYCRRHAQAVARLPASTNSPTQVAGSVRRS